MPLIVAAIGRESIICCDCEVKSQDETRSRSHLPGRGELNGWGLRAALLDLLIAAWPMPDYLELASEAEDFAAWTPDQEKARSEVGAPLGSGETRTACTYFYRVAIIPCQEWPANLATPSRFVAHQRAGLLAPASFAPQTASICSGPKVQGAKTADQSEPRRDRESKDADRVAADIFSITIREYSAGGHLPSAIIAPRRPMVSQEASANSIIISGNGTDFLRRRFLMSSR
jgi:hypothetical protein